MSLTTGQLIEEAKKFGYTLDFGIDYLTITNRNTPSLFVTILLILAGLFIFPFAIGDPKGIILVILLILYPLVTFRWNTSKKIKLVFDRSVILNKSVFLVPVRTKYEMNEPKLIYKEFERQSYASAMDSSNMEYFASIKLVLEDRHLVELFHFVARYKENLDFVPDLLEQMKTTLGATLEVKREETVNN